MLQPSDLHGGNLLRILCQHIAQIHARQRHDNQPIHMARGHQHDAFLLHFRRPPDTQRQLPAALVDQRLKRVDKPCAERILNARHNQADGSRHGGTQRAGRKIHRIVEAVGRGPYAAGDVVVLGAFAGKHTGYRGRGNICDGGNIDD